MRKFVVLSLAVVVLSLLLLTMSIVLGRQQPIGAGLAVLHLTDCELPCWIGIVPGKTQVSAAQERVSTLFGQLKFVQAEVNASASPVELQTWRVSVSSSPVQIKLGALDGNTIDTITFVFSDGQATVADLYRILGAPSRMAHWHQNFPYFVMAYGTDDRGLMVFSDLSDRFSWTQPVRALTIYANGRSPIASDDMRPWIGFHNLRTYFDRMP